MDTMTDKPMNTIHIHARPDRLYMPLEPLAVGRLSSAVATVGGDIPDDIETLAAVVQYPDGDSVGTYTAAGTKQADGRWRVYFAPAYFPTGSQSLRYDLVGTDSQGNPRWLGSGVLRVMDNPSNGSAVTPDVLPRNLYAYSPSRGCYFKVIAAENEYGEIRLDVDETPVNL